MTALILQTVPFVELLARKLLAIGTRLAHAVDALAAAKVRNATPEWQLRQAQHEISRYQRLMQHSRKAAVKTARGRR